MKRVRMMNDKPNTEEINRALIVKKINNQIKIIKIKTKKSNLSLLIMMTGQLPLKVRMKMLFQKKKLTKNLSMQRKTMKQPKNSKAMLNKLRVKSTKKKLMNLKRTRKKMKMKLMKKLLIKRMKKTKMIKKKTQRKRMTKIKKMIIDLFIKLTTLITCSLLIFVLPYVLPSAFHIFLHMPFKICDQVGSLLHACQGSQYFLLLSKLEVVSHIQEL